MDHYDWSRGYRSRYLQVLVNIDTIQCIVLFSFYIEACSW